jgi:hypothetical protein
MDTRAVDLTQDVDKELAHILLDRAFARSQLHRDWCFFF